MGDLGIHKADLIRWLIGDEIQEVKAYVTTLDKKGPDGKLIEIDDNAICLLQSRTGIIGTLTAGWTNYGNENNSTVLYCSEGTMKIYDNPDFPLEIVKKDGEKVYYKIGGIQTNTSQTKSGIIDQFIASIEAGTPPEISGEEGLAALRIIFACFESSAIGAKVVLE
jgi:predicted dehydrogenase